MDRRSTNSFDHLRLLFASAVLASHAPQLVLGSEDGDPLKSVLHTANLGVVAVFGFFIVSGYLIARSWDQSRDALVFATNRVLRIVPAFVVAFTISVLVVGAIGAPDARAYFARMDWGLIGREIVSLHRPVTPPVFVGTFGASVNNPMWTIAVEASCYAMTPLLAFRRSTAIAGWLVIFTAAVLAPGTLASFVLMFASGALIARLDWRPGWRSALAGALLVVLAVTSHHFWRLGFATGGAAIVLWVGSLRAPKLPADVSYGTYLYGWPIEKLLFMAGVVAPWSLFLLSLALSLAAGWASWMLIERHALKLRGRQLYSQMMRMPLAPFPPAAAPPAFDDAAPEPPPP